MGIELTENIKARMSRAERKKFGRRGETAAETLHRVTTVAERKIHDQFIGFLRRHSIPYWHSNPVARSSIRTGLPDFLLLKGGRGLCIEFKVAPNKVSAVQEEVFAELRAAGNTVCVCEEAAPGQAYAQATILSREFYSLPSGLD